jgi:hypothetical protein
MSAQDPSVAAPAPATQSTTNAGFFTKAIDELKKIKSSVIHFFTSTKAGQTIEHVGLQISALPGFHAFITKYEGVGIQIVHDLIAAAAVSPGSKSVNDVLKEAGSAIAEAAKEGLNNTSAGWEHALASIALQNVSAIPGMAGTLALLAPSIQ